MTKHRKKYIKKQSMKISGIEISHPDKILFPEGKITKSDVARYYDKMAGHILPVLRNRPLTLERFPEGVQRQGFFQKHAQDYFPDFVERVTVKTKEGTVEEVMVNNRESLLYLVNQSAVTFHIWLSSKDHLEKPDKVIFDLDPSEEDFGKLKRGARLLKDALEKKEIQPQLMTSGKRGLHVFYPIIPDKGFDEVRREAKGLAEKLVEAHPNLFTLEVRKNKRGDKIFLDTLRNAYGQTGVCPYSLRPNASAGVATPLEWSELSRVSSGHQYSYKNIFRRLAAKNA